MKNSAFKILDSSVLDGHSYFPCCLQNGIDSILVGMLGSPDGTWEYSSHLSRQCAVGWYKTDRRENRIDNNLIELVNLSVQPFIGKEEIVIADFKQVFDARTATLTTEYHQRDNRGTGVLRVRVMTFMTRDHLLVERYDLLELPSQGGAFRFSIGPAGQPEIAQLPGSSFTKPVISWHLSEGPMETGVGFSWLTGFSSGYGCTWTDLPGTKAQPGWGAVPRFNGYRSGISLKTPLLHETISFTRYSCVVDEIDANGAAVKDCLMMVAKKVNTLGYDGIRAEHVEYWRQFFATSNITMAVRPDIQYAYEFTRYYVKTCQDERTGFSPVGLQPFLWQGYQFWDWHFFLFSWLGANNLDEARRVCEFVLTHHERAKKLAALMGNCGARLAWRTGIHEFEGYPEKCLQLHNNSVAAYALYCYYRSTGDKSFLSACFDFMDDLLLFMTDRVITDNGDYAIIGECMGVDESFCDHKVNDTWTCAITICALEGLHECAAALGRTPATPTPDILAQKLRRGLDRNVDANGVMQSFEGGTIPHWGSLIFAHLHEHPALKATMARILENYDPELDLYNTHGQIRYAEKSFPWTDFWSARILALANDPQAGELINKQMRYANRFGGLAERVFYDGRLFKEYTCTVHAVFAWAVQGCLVNQVGDRLKLFPGTPADWGDISFVNLRTEDGLLVSATRTNGIVTSLIVESPRGNMVLKIRFPYGEDQSALLEKGINNINIMTALRTT